MDWDKVKAMRVQSDRWALSEVTDRVLVQTYQEFACWDGISAEQALDAARCAMIGAVINSVGAEIVTEEENEFVKSRPDLSEEYYNRYLELEGRVLSFIREEVSRIKCRIQASQ